MKKKIITISVIVLLVLAVAGGFVFYLNTPYSKSKRQVKEGLELLENKKYSKAVNCFQEAVTLNENNIEAYGYLADALSGDGKMSEAVKALKTGADATDDTILKFRSNATDWEDTGFIDHKINFKDDKVIHALKMQINSNSDNIKISEVWDLNKLYLYESFMYSFDPEGLEELINLEAIYLYRNQISDISFISKLKNVKEFYLAYNDISNISSLTKTQVTHLDLSNNNISDISNLSVMSSLKYLDLSFNSNITDISALAGLSNLTYLDISGTSVNDLSALTKCTNLKTLVCEGLSINDYSFLCSLTNLENLDLTYTSFNDGYYLMDLKNLKSLELANTNVNDSLKDFVSDLTLLDYLDIRGTRVNSIGSFSNIENVVFN